jgi:alginate O-acetyltransferase complex protein AlgJ
MSREAAVHTLLFSSVIAVTGLLAAVSARSFRLPEHITVSEGGLAKAFETHYEQHFPAKQLGVNLWAAIDYTLFREGRPGVVIGADDWLYTDEEFNVADDARATFHANFARIAEVRAALETAGVALVAALVPAKARIYSEFLVDRKPAEPHVELYDELLARLAAEGIPTADLRTPLTDGKQQRQTYFRTDTHWTPWGARLAATEVARVTHVSGLAPDDDSDYETRVERTAAHRGDLCNFLPLAPYFTQLLPPRERIDITRTDITRAQGAQKSSPAAADLFGDSNLPNVVLVGTSYSANPLWNFAGFLKEALHTDVASYARAGAGPFQPMLAYLKSADFRDHRPHLVIWEIPERALLVTARADTAAQTR